MASSSSSFKLVFLSSALLLILAQLFSSCNAEVYCCNKEEKAALAKFRPLVKEILTQDYMSTDWFLVNFLRAKKLDVNAAKALLKKSLDWRKDNKIDNVLNEDFSEWEKKYRMSWDSVDKTGRPVYVNDWGSFDLRKAALAGKLPALQRYIFAHWFEHPTTKIREFQASGKNVTQYIYIYDMTKYNLRQQACVLCAPLYLQAVTTYETNYPERCFKYFLVNTPTVFSQIFSLMKPLMSEALQRDFLIYGFDKAEWQGELLKYIDADQLPVQLGGTKTKDNAYA